MVSKALVVGAYRRKLAEMAKHRDVELVVVVPPSWREGAFERRLEAASPDGYELIVSPIAANGNFHLYFFPKLANILDRLRPDLVHVDEEPYNLATFLAVLHARKRAIPSLFFTWQNLNRRYPLPFRLMEQYVYRSVVAGIAGTPAAERVLRAKGYRGPVAVIPQFGVDPDVFRPADTPARRGVRALFTIGFAGRLVPEKGVGLLLDACAQLTIDYRLVILGQGPSLGDLQAQASRLGLASRVSFEGPVASTDMPRRLRELDALVLPSLTRPNWAEQFGRVLVEAMACGVNVIGSSSGEIPDVIGDAGLIVPEGDHTALAGAIETLAADVDLRRGLAQRGRARVLDRYTQARIAEATVDAYRRAISPASGPARSG